MVSAMGVTRRRWRERRFVLVCAAVVALSLVVPVALADATYPELDVYAYDQTLGGTTDLSLEFAFVPSLPAAETAVVTVPKGYTANLAQTPGTQLGYAEIDAIPGAGGATAVFKGKTVAVDPTAFAADTIVQTCAPGPHTGTWQLVLSGPPASSSRSRSTRSPTVPQATGSRSVSTRCERPG